jgi:hypothetical protein
VFSLASGCSIATRLTIGNLSALIASAQTISAGSMTLTSILISTVSFSFLQFQ